MVQKINPGRGQGSEHRHVTLLRGKEENGVIKFWVLESHLDHGFLIFASSCPG